MTKPITHRPLYQDGRKHRFKCVEDLQTAIDAYFDTCDAGKEIETVIKGHVVTIRQQTPYTCEGLVLSMGYADRSELSRLAKKPAFRQAIHAARARIAGHRLEQTLLGNHDSRIAQFDLINNHGYLSSKQQVEVNSTVEMSSKELDQKLAALEAKMRSLPGQQDTPLIEADFTSSEVD